MSINAKIDRKIIDFKSSEKFIGQWIDYLKTTPWGNTNCIFDNLIYENALSWPLFITQYETKTINDFKVESHVLGSGEKIKPTIENLRVLSQILEFDYDSLYEEIMKLSNDFHERFYTGHRTENMQEDPMHGIHQRLMNETLKNAYKSEIKLGLRNTNDVDIGITICIRIDNLFSSRPIKINMENYIEATESYILGMEIYPYESIDVSYEYQKEEIKRFGNSYATLSYVKRRALKKLKEFYQNQEDHLKEEIISEDTEENKKSRKWVNDIEFPTNSCKVKL